MINEGIIKIPIKRVVATDTPISDEERAHSFVVHMILPSETYTFYSFSRIDEVGDITAGLKSPQLVLESIPSLDKKIYYEMVAEFLKGVTTIKEFDIAIDIISGDGSVIETLDYNRCKVSGYWVYVNDDERDYRFADKDEMEIRDWSYFECSGYRLQVP